MSNANKVEIIAVPNTLKERVTVLESSDELTFDDSSILVDLSQQFVERLPDELRRIDQAYEGLKTSPHDDFRCTVLFRLVHDLKGMAGSFNYPLISIIGNDLCRFLEYAEALTPARLHVIGFHIDAIKRVVDKRITGEPGEQGTRIVNALHAMTQKVLQK